jgi:hypothetical protein
VDREEITVIGTLPPPEVGADASDAERAAAADGRARSFRESTREQRIAIAARRSTGSTARWRGASRWTARALFTHLAVPVMTRLRQPSGWCSTPW